MGCGTSSPKVSNSPHRGGVSKIPFDFNDEEEDVYVPVQFEPTELVRFDAQTILQGVNRITMPSKIFPVVNFASNNFPICITPLLLDDHQSSTIEMPIISISRLDYSKCPVEGAEAENFIPKSGRIALFGSIDFLSNTILDNPESAAFIENLITWGSGYKSMSTKILFVGFPSSIETPASKYLSAYGINVDSSSDLKTPLNYDIVFLSGIGYDPSMDTNLKNYLDDGKSVFIFGGAQPNCPVRHFLLNKFLKPSGLAISQNPMSPSNDISLFLTMPSLENYTYDLIFKKYKELLTENFIEEEIKYFKEKQKVENENEEEERQEAIAKMEEFDDVISILRYHVQGFPFYSEKAFDVAKTTWDFIEKVGFKDEKGFFFPTPIHSEFAILLTEVIPKIPPRMLKGLHATFPDNLYGVLTNQLHSTTGNSNEESNKSSTSSLTTSSNSNNNNYAHKDIENKNSKNSKNDTKTSSKKGNKSTSTTNNNNTSNDININKGSNSSIKSNSHNDKNYKSNANSNNNNNNSNDNDDKKEASETNSNNDYSSNQFILTDSESASNESGISKKCDEDNIGYVLSSDGQHLPIELVDSSMVVYVFPNVWNFTGLFLPAGTVGVVRSDSPVIIQVGAHVSPLLFRPCSLKRWPSVTHRVFVEPDKDIEITSPFGGIVYLISDVPKTVQVKFKNFSDYPCYIYEDTNGKQKWNETKVSNAPWGEIILKNGAFVLPSEKIKEISDLSSFCQKISKLISCILSIVGSKQGPFHHIVFDCELPTDDNLPYHNDILVLELNSINDIIDLRKPSYNLFVFLTYISFGSIVDAFFDKISEMTFSRVAAAYAIDREYPNSKIVSTFEGGNFKLYESLWKFLKNYGSKGIAVSMEKLMNNQEICTTAEATKFFVSNLSAQVHKPLPNMLEKFNHVGKVEDSFSDRLTVFKMNENDFQVE